MSKSKVSTLNRREVREKAIQTLFQLSMNTDLDIIDAINYVLNMNNSELTIDNIPYLKELVYGVQQNKIELDDKIQKQLENWSFNRITKIDLAILRLAIFELFYISDEIVPKKVVINEAIELAKLYCDDKSPKFINGILSNMIK